MPKVSKATGEVWETRFGELKQYRNDHGDCNVPQRQGKLGRWVKNQRHRRGKLDQARVDRLVGIGFLFAGDAKAALREATEE
ncbi:hypothetical protein THAOC_11548, partial [Thalassiosira oceanica]